MDPVYTNEQKFQLPDGLLIKDCIQKKVPVQAGPANSDPNHKTP